MITSGIGPAIVRRLPPAVKALRLWLFSLQLAESTAAGACPLEYVGLEEARRPPDDSSPVHLASVPDPRDDDDPLGVVDGVDHAVVADADSVVVAPRQLRCTRRPWIERESVDSRLDTVA